MKDKLVFSTHGDMDHFPSLISGESGPLYFCWLPSPRYGSVRTVIAVNIHLISLDSFRCSTCREVCQSAENQKVWTSGFVHFRISSNKPGSVSLLAARLAPHRRRHDANGHRRAEASDCSRLLTLGGIQWDLGPTQSRKCGRKVPPTTVTPCHDDQRLHWFCMSSSRGDGLEGETENEAPRCKRRKSVKKEKPKKEGGVSVFSSDCNSNGAAGGLASPSHSQSALPPSSSLPPSSPPSSRCHISIHACVHVPYKIDGDSQKRACL